MPSALCAKPSTSPKRSLRSRRARRNRQSQPTKTAPSVRRYARSNESLLPHIVMLRSRTFRHSHRKTRARWPCIPPLQHDFANPGPCAGRSACVARPHAGAASWRMTAPERMESAAAAPARCAHSRTQRRIALGTRITSRHTVQRCTFCRGPRARLS